MQYSEIKSILKASKFYLYFPLKLLTATLKKKKKLIHNWNVLIPRNKLPQAIKSFNLHFESCPEFCNQTRFHMPNEALWNENKETIILCISPYNKLGFLKSEDKTKKSIIIQKRPLRYDKKQNMLSFHFPFQFLRISHPIIDYSSWSPFHQ